eukprot:SAG31_NODE_21254_length_554_cov_0.782418_2_plen_36_part_01
MANERIGVKPNNDSAVGKDHTRCRRMAQAKAGRQAN